jgi:hypothetical protein
VDARRRRARVLISPTAKIEVAGEANAIRSDISEKVFQDCRIVRAFCIKRETCYTAALPSA